MRDGSGLGVDHDVDVHPLGVDGARGALEAPPEAARPASPGGLRRDRWFSMTLRSISMRPMAASAPGASSKKRATNSRHEKVRTKARSAMGAAVFWAISAMRTTLVCAESTMTRVAARTSRRERRGRALAHLDDGRHLREGERREHRGGAHRGHGPEAQLDAVVAEDGLALLVADGADVGLELPGGEAAVDRHHEDAARAGLRELLDAGAGALDLRRRRRPRRSSSSRRAPCWPALVRGGGPERGELCLDAG